MLETPKALVLIGKKRRDVTMDNQQETLKVYSELGWLGGIIDGEGSIDLKLATKLYGYTHGRYLTITPSLIIGNTDELIIRKVCELYDSMGLTYYKKLVAPKKASHKPMWRIKIERMKTLEKLIPTIKQFLFGIKREKAELVLQFCRKRINNTTHQYNREEKEIICNFMRMSGKQISHELQGFLRDLTQNIGIFDDGKVQYDMKVS
jgi:hypothetical protein